MRDVLIATLRKVALAFQDGQGRVFRKARIGFGEDAKHKLAATLTGDYFSMSTIFTKTFVHALPASALQDPAARE
jgi:hypothetical protein